MEILKVENLSVKIGDRYILREVNFSISDGEKIFIVGPNGAGKTTLIETIMGFVKPESGSIYLFGEKVHTENDFYKLRTTIGYIFQNSDDQLFSPTVEEELAFGPLNLGLNRKEIERRIETVLKNLGIEHLRKRYTHQLSGGEKRIVSIASVLTMEPECLVMDEPSTGLDEEKFSHLVSFLKNTNKSIIVVTHDKELIEKLNWKIYRMKNGQLVRA